jgi:hypothetical protein
MMAAVPAPLALSKTIRQRQTCFCAELRSLVIVSRLSQSESETMTDIPMRIRKIRTCRECGKFQIGLDHLQDIMSAFAMSAACAAFIARVCSRPTPVIAGWYSQCPQLAQKAGL